MKVITRIAPSPTGYMHIGTVRTALYNYLLAKKSGGKFVMRIEDTDTKRNRPEYEEDIREQFKWVGFEPEETIRQSDNLARHVAVLKQMIDSGKAYISREPSKDDPTREMEIVRLKNPNKKITFNDAVRGDITFDTTELGDFVIARSPESPLFHLAVVVDDADMGITHVIRGEEHISNTPRQILIQEALDLPRPIYAHLALNLAADRSKLSKRKGDVSVKAYREHGYLPEALVNYLAILGWTPPSRREILSLDEMVSEFALADLHKSGAIFDGEKLRWFTQQYWRRLPDDEYVRRLKEAAGIETTLQVVPLLKERAHTFSEAAELLTNGEFYFLSDTITFDPALLISGAKTDAETAKRHLAHVLELLTDARAFDSESIKATLMPYATEEGRGKVLWPLRIALSGREKSPDPFLIASLIGKEKTLERIQNAITML